jgi:hypothetical protein
LVESGVERRQIAYRLKFTQVIVVWASIAMSASLLIADIFGRGYYGS